MRILTVLFAVWALAAAEKLTAFRYEWSVIAASDWNVAEQGNATVLRLVKSRDPLPGPRRPCQFALAETPEFRAVTVEADVRPLGRSLIIVFNYQNAAHFDYAHLSIDPATKQPMHNGIFHVFGGERVRISSEAGPAAFPAGNHWYHVWLANDGRSGDVQVTVEGRGVPALHAVDLSLDHGRVGVGSFDETGDFKNVRISGVTLKDAKGQ